MRVSLLFFQKKVVKLQKMINLLHLRYNRDELQNLEQYQRLMSLYDSLKPLLPHGSVSDLNMVEEEEQEQAETGVTQKKRSAFNMDFMGEPRTQNPTRTPITSLIIDCRLRSLPSIKVPISCSETLLIPVI